MTVVLDYPEGATPLDLNELEGLKHKHITTQGELNELEHANIQAGLLWLGVRKNPDLLTDEFTLQLHRRLFGNVWDWAGTMRTTEKNIGIDPLHIAVQLRNLVDDTKAWLKYKTYPAAEAAIIFHHKLVRIHVFPNGNGRHARIMADALLEKIYKVAPIDWSGGYDLKADNARRKQYIAALKAADGENYKPLMAFAGIKQ